MAENFLYLTTKGRTSGKPRQIEIWFVEHDGRFFLVSERREESGWLKNIQANPEVTWSVGTRSDQQSAVPLRSGKGRVVSASAEPELAKTVAVLMDKKYKWSDGLIVELAGDSQ